MNITLAPGGRRFSARTVVGLINAAIAQTVGTYLITDSMGVTVTVAAMATTLVGWVLTLDR
ncbi:hypothetical protein [Rhizocola hellebori]|uniref:hypothetical protein n=1 Tax=Rhizocola hellebori TaxID=1392758 RepID=UPI0019451F13|nr:hypothetical protein [Rhizocola hellebori]